MNEGFFLASEPTAKAPISRIPKCGACGLFRNCNSPKMKVYGNGGKGVLIIGEAPGCIGGDSLIDTAFRDKHKYPNGIPIQDLVGLSDFFVYSFNTKKQKLVLGKVKRVWKTGRKKVYRVTYKWHFARGRKKVTMQDSLVVSANHPFLLKRKIPHDPFGSRFTRTEMYLSIDQGLSVGDSIQPFHRQMNGEYAYVGAFSNETVKESRFLLEHKIGRNLVGDEECHHKNETKVDDSWSNLKLLTKITHARYHKNKSNPMSNMIIRKRYDKIMKSELYRKNHSRIMKEVWRKKKELDNHRIIKIEYIGVQDVYDIEVEKYHNFAVNGIFVHNSEEDSRGIPFIGRAGQKLRSTLHDLGIRIKRDCWVTNTLICRPPKNRTPSPREIDYCRPNILNTIEKLKPNVIILLGGAAISSLIGYLWQDSPGEVGRWVGWQIPSQKLNCWICPTYHPSFVMRNQDQKNGPVSDLLFERHLEAAFKITAKPWNLGTPDYKKQIKIELNPIKAADFIHWAIEDGGPVAFDYETTCLKPEWDGAEIVCCSLYKGGSCGISFPWHGAAIPAMQKFLRSDVPKIASNMKFEDRWSKRILGCRVRNWKWDTMLSAHILDNRRGITSIKFQAFIHLGTDPYNRQIEDYLEAKKGSHLNRVKEIELDKLLLYCGLDSLLELKIAQMQAKKLGMSLC
jgi:uracil-DNA glycosylase family 4